MIRHTAVFAALLAAAATPAFAETQSKTYDLSGFHGVKISTGLSAKIKAGEAFSVRAEGSPEQIERLDIHLDGETLILTHQHKPGRSWSNIGHVEIFVTLPKLDALAASSGSSATAEGVAADGFSASASSGASLEVSGSCATLSAQASSGASLDINALKCKSASVTASSGASLHAYADEAVTASASSGASVNVDGSPKSVTKTASSGGSVSVR